MRILLFGANGQLGQELSRVLTSLGEIMACGRADVDLTSDRAIIEAIDDCGPDVIVNAAAYTAVDKAESEREIAFKINAEAVKVMGIEAAKRGIGIVHYSTDYVFDGAKTAPYSETDAPNPINVYGASKLAGDQAIAETGCEHAIFRVSWLIGSGGDNFVKRILELAQKKDQLQVVEDQIGVPTSSTLIAKITIAYLKALSASESWQSGVYHLAPHGQTSWFDMAQTILQIASEENLSLRSSVNSLHPIKTAAYQSPAKRPLNSLLDTRKLERQLTFSLPDWKYDFLPITKEVIREMKHYAT